MASSARDGDPFLTTGVKSPTEKLKVKNIRLIRQDLLERRTQIGKSFNDVECVRGWESINTIMENLEKLHENIYQLLREDPQFVADHLWSENGLLSMERNCGCQMISEVRFGPDNEFVCAGCRAVSTVADLNVQTETFEIKIGSYAGWHWRVYPQVVGSTICQLGERPSARISHLLNSQPCGRVADFQYMKCDQFTNFFLAALLWERLGREKGFSTPHLMTAFVCNEIGYLVLEDNLPYERTESPTEAFVKGTLFQLFFQLQAIQEWEGTLGDPSLRRLQILNMPCQYSFAGKVHNFPFKLLIIPSGVTSFNLPNSVTTGGVQRITQGGTPNTQRYRIRNQNPKLTLGVERVCFNPDFDIRTGSSNVQQLGMSKRCGEDQVRATYRITQNIKRTLEYLRYSGIPLFKASIDVYILFTALMCHAPFYQALMRSETAKACWKDLWGNSDVVDASVRKWHNGPAPSTTDLLEILIDVELKCDPIPGMMQKLM